MMAKYCLLFVIAFFCFILENRIVSGNSCTTKPVAIVSISSNLTKTQLSSKPNISNYSGLVNISDSCCLYGDSQRDIAFCDDLEPMIVFLNNFNRTDIKPQIVFYLGNEGDTIELLLSLIAEELEHFKQTYVYGYGDVSIINTNTNTNKSLFYFIDTLEIAIQNVTLKNGGLFFENCFNVQLINVNILDNTISGILVTISDPIMANPLPYISYTFISCSFINNGNETTIYGGGIHIAIEEDYQQIVVKLMNCVFDQNFAIAGGAMSVDLRDLPVTNGCQNLVPLFVIDNCSFTNNHVRDHGGAIFIETYSKALYSLETYVSNFVNNSAVYSGGAFYSSINNYDITCNKPSSILFRDCNWERNSARLSAVVGLHNTQPFHSTVTIENNTLANNHARTFSYGGDTYCIMYCDGMNVTLNATEFLNNDGSGICIQNSQLLIKQTVTFRLNSAYQGGGIFLDNNAWISLPYNDSYLILAENKAVYGGGLYQKSLPSDTEMCFLTKTNDSVISFYDNFAYTSGDDIYFQSPSTQCQIELSKVSFVSDMKVSTSVYSIQILNQTVDILLGQKLALIANVSDFFGNAASTFVSIFLLEKNKTIFENDLYNFSGFTSFSIINGSNSPDVYITGPNNKTAEGDYSIVISTSEQANQIEINLPLTISNCILGFTYVPTTHTCICASSDLQCDLYAGTACAEKGYWFGDVGDYESILAPCSSGKCKNIAESCTVCPSKGLTTFCLLSKNESGECIDNWAGALCTECKPGYAYTFQAQNCVKSYTCTNAFALIPAVLMVAYLSIVIGIIFMILKLGNHVKSAYLYCIIYYFSIVKLLLPERVVSKPLVIIVSIFQSVLQLDPYFLGYIPVCISPNITILEQKILSFVNPLVISIVILGIISLSKYCSYRWIKFKDNSVVKAISLLALLSFTTLTNASFNIITPIKFNSLDISFVKIQPSTKYLDPKEHLPWWIIAVLIIGVLVIPFTLFLFVAPFLVRCINLTKIKPFLDEFQSCYKDKYRWMAGYYFLCRIILFLALTGSVAEREKFQYTAMILSIFVLIFHMLLQPYQDKWLNVIDSILLADLVFVAVLYNISSEILFHEITGGESLRQFFTYLLVIIPLVYITVLAALVFVHKLPSKFKRKAKNIFSNEKMMTMVKITKGIQHNDYVHYNHSSSLSGSFNVPSTEIRLLDSCSDYREPLIESNNDTGSTLLSRNKNSHTGRSNDSTVS